MQYAVNKTNFHDFSVFEENRLKPRSYFIPYPDRASADAVSLREKRYASPKVTCLNGDWDFRFWRDPKQLPDLIDTDKMVFDVIDVPSCWQFRGYMKPFYVNTRYQFPYNPPVIPTEEPVGKVFSWMGADKGIGLRFDKAVGEYNSAGIYRKLFNVKKDETRKVVSFFGAASCLDLYVNGKHVGYSEGSHNIAEFDISAYTKAGENEMLVIVRRWCTGTYLEAQDMFRNNGLFRDVLLYETEKTDPWEIEAKTEKTDAGYSLSVTVDFAGAEDGTAVTALLCGNGLEKELRGTCSGGQARFSFSDLDVIEWNAEAPTLYNLYIETATSAVKLRIGFRDIHISGTHFKVNGRLVKFHGVNHHDTSAVNGYTMTPEEIEKDVKICKEFNIDTIRTSHYPPDPYLIELADELGIYIVDETDLETHGTFSMVIPPSYNYITNDPKWGPRCVDRVSRLYERDKNHPSIIMWSLGNEAGGTACTDMEEAYLKARTTIPVHYESAIHTKKHAYDVGSQMYPSVERVHEVGEKTCKVKELNDRPYFLCEYAHAMGVGPGNIEDYWQEIYKYDNLMGGCIWEMVDHAVLEEDGSYTYGGDHGEFMHDSNFCVDGIFYPDRTPSTGAFIAKFTYRPIRVRHLYGNTFEIFNTTGFTPGSRYELKLAWSDGRTGSVIPEVGPLERIRMELLPENEAPEGYEPLPGDLLLTITTVDRETGREAAVEQLTVKQDEYLVPAGGISGIGEKPLPAKIEVHDHRVWFDFGGVRFATGLPGTILFRAATDNDADVIMRNSMKPYYSEKEEIISEVRAEGKVTVKSRVSVNRMEFLVTDVYESANEGVLVTSTLHPMNGKGEIPRFGKAYRLMNSFTDVTYVGRIGESYIDMKDQFPIARTHARVVDMTEPNIRPQESGNRCDVRCAAFTNGRNTVSFEALEKPFELSVKPYSDRALTKMRHTTDEKAVGTFVTINAFQKGIGTGSCGPATADRFTFKADRDYTVSYLIRVK